MSALAILNYYMMNTMINIIEIYMGIRSENGMFMRIEWLDFKFRVHSRLLPSALLYFCSFTPTMATWHKNGMKHREKAPAIVSYNLGGHITYFWCNQDTIFHVETLHRVLQDDDLETLISSSRMVRCNKSPQA